MDELHDHDNHADEYHKHDILNVKIISSIVLLGISLIAGLIPILSKKLQKNETAIAYAQCFSAGMFMAIAFIHLIPEANEGFEEARPEIKYPICYLVVILSYTLILVIEKVLFNAHDLIEVHEHEHHEHG